MGAAMRRLVLLASAIVFLDTVFYAAITPLLPHYAAAFGLTKSGAGVLSGAYPAGTFVASLPAGWLAARAGTRPTVVVGLTLMVVSSVAFAFAPSIEMLDGARFLQGVGGAASWTGALGWLIGAAPRERRGELLGSAMGMAVVGALFGPALGGAAASLGSEGVFSGVAVLGLGLLAWALRTQPQPRAADSSLRHLARAARDRRVFTGMGLVAMPGVLFGTISVLGSLRLGALGAGAATIAGAFLGGAALEAVVSPVVGRVADRRGRLLPSLVGLGSAAVIMALLPWPGTMALLFVLVVLAAPLIGILWAPAMAMLADGADARGLDQGFAFSLMNLAWATGQTAGSAGSARLAAAFGDRVPYLLLSALCVAVLLILRGGRYAERANGHGLMHVDHTRTSA